MTYGNIYHCTWLWRRFASSLSNVQAFGPGTASVSYTLYILAGQCLIPVLIICLVPDIFIELMSSWRQSSLWLYEHFDFWLSGRHLHEPSSNQTICYLLCQVGTCRANSCNPLILVKNLCAKIDYLKKRQYFKPGDNDYLQTVFKAFDGH